MVFLVYICTYEYNVPGHKSSSPNPSLNPWCFLPNYTKYSNRRPPKAKSAESAIKSLVYARGTYKTTTLVVTPAITLSQKALGGGVRLFMPEQAAAA